jgi:hypothetical protein
VTKGHTFTAIDHDHQSGLLHAFQAAHPVGTWATGAQTSTTLNGLLDHPQRQSSLRPFPHMRGRKLWGLPLVTHGGSDPCQIHVWESSFSEIVVVWHSHPFSSSSSVLAIGASLIENLRPHSGSSLFVVRPLPWSLSSSRLSSSLIFLSL